MPKPILPSQASVPLPLPPARNKEEELKQKVIIDQVPTAIADAGCTTNCNMEFVSECGEYGLEYQPYTKTGAVSNKIFSYVGGGLAAATDINQTPFEVRKPASTYHTVPGIRHNLLSTAKYVDAGYAWLFDNDEEQACNRRNRKITTSRAAVMKGWRVPGENLWRVPIVKENNQATFDKSNTVSVKASLVQLLQSCPPPKPETIANVYDLKTQPELVRYYHAASGFPTKPTWLAAIKIVTTGHGPDSHKR